jgi:predicted heme/steroid binding protein
MRTFSRAELAACNGKDGAPAYVAFEGKVYDLSRSFLWQRGRHQVTHPAGVDYTGGLGAAPHGPDLLERFPVVGLLATETDR